MRITASGVEGVKQDVVWWQSEINKPFYYHLIVFVRPFFTGLNAVGKLTVLRVTQYSAERMS